MIRDVRSFDKRYEVWAQLCDCPLHGALHSPVSTRRQVTCVVGSCAVFHQLLQAEDAANELHQLGDAWIAELSMLTLSTEDVELEVTNVGDGHSDLGRLELIIILILRRGGRCIVLSHRRMN